MDGSGFVSGSDGRALGSALRPRVWEVWLTGRAQRNLSPRIRGPDVLLDRFQPLADAVWRPLEAEAEDVRRYLLLIG